MEQWLPLQNRNSTYCEWICWGLWYWHYYLRKSLLLEPLFPIPRSPWCRFWSSFIRTFSRSIWTPLDRHVCWHALSLRQCTLFLLRIRTCYSAYWKTIYWGCHRSYLNECTCLLDRDLSNLTSWKAGCFFHIFGSFRITNCKHHGINPWREIYWYGLVQRSYLFYLICGCYALDARVTKMAGKKWITRLSCNSSEANI